MGRDKIYAKLNCLVDTGRSDKSPVVFLHGFPDSPRMFAAYSAEAERQQPWRQGRSIYTYNYPNRHDNSNFPPLSALASEVMAREFDEAMNQLVKQSPTGKLIFIVHDWGLRILGIGHANRRIPRLKKW